MEKHYMVMNSRDEGARISLKSLGIHFDLTNQSDGGLDHLKTKFGKQCGYIRCARASSATKMAALSSAVMGMANYYGPQTTCNLKTLRELDSLLIDLLKEISKNMRTFPHDLLFLPRKLGGLGFPRLSESVVHSKLKTLLRMSATPGYSRELAAALLLRPSRNSGKLHPETGPIKITAEKTRSQYHWVTALLERVEEAGGALYLEQQGTPPEDAQLMFPNLTLPSLEFGAVGEDRRWNADLIGYIKAKGPLPQDFPEAPPAATGNPLPVRVGLMIEQTKDADNETIDIIEYMGLSARNSWQFRKWKPSFPQDVTYGCRVEASLEMIDKDRNDIPTNPRLVIIDKSGPNKGIYIGTTDPVEITGPISKKQKHIEWLEEIKSFSANGGAVTEAHTDGSFRRDAHRLRDFTELPPYSTAETIARKHTHAGFAVVFSKDKTQCRTEELLILQVTDDGCGVGSAYPMELAALAAATITSTELSTPLRNICTDCKSAQEVANNMKFKPTRQTSEYHAIAMAMQETYAANKLADHKKIPDITHIRAHPEKSSKNPDNWSADQYLNHVADNFSGQIPPKEGDEGNYSIYMNPDQPLKIIRIGLSTYLESIRKPGSIHFRQAEGTLPLVGLKTLLELIEELEYKRKRDGFRVEADPPREIIWVGTSTQLGVRATKLEKATIPSAALAIRSMFDKHMHNGQYMKQSAITHDTEAGRKCPLCEGTDSQCHILLHCTHKKMRAKRRELLERIERTTRRKNPIHRGICEATFQTAIRCHESTPDSHRLWYGIMTEKTRDHWETRLPQEAQSEKLPNGTFKRYRKIIVSVIDDLYQAALSLWFLRRDLIEENKQAERTKTAKETGTADETKTTDVPNVPVLGGSPTSSAVNSTNTSPTAIRPLKPRKTRSRNKHSGNMAQTTPAETQPSLGVSTPTAVDRRTNMGPPANRPPREPGNGSAAAPMTPAATHPIEIRDSAPGATVHTTETHGDGPVSSLETTGQAGQGLFVGPSPWTITEKLQGVSIKLMCPVNSLAHIRDLARGPNPLEDLREWIDMLLEPSISLFFHDLVDEGRRCPRDGACMYHAWITAATTEGRTLGSTHGITTATGRTNMLLFLKNMMAKLPRPRQQNLDQKELFEKTRRLQAWLMDPDTAGRTLFPLGNPADPNWGSPLQLREIPGGTLHFSVIGTPLAPTTPGYSNPSEAALMVDSEYKKRTNTFTANELGEIAGRNNLIQLIDDHYRPVITSQPRAMTRENLNVLLDRVCHRLKNKVLLDRNMPRSGPVKFTVAHANLYDFTESGTASKTTPARRQREQINQPFRIIPKRSAAKTPAGGYDDERPNYMNNRTDNIHLRSYHPHTKALLTTSEPEPGHPDPHPVQDDPDRQNLAVGISTIEGAGNGLFALKRYLTGDRICEYAGRKRTAQDIQDGLKTTVAMKVNNRLTIIAQEIGHAEFMCKAAYINDPIDIARDNCRSDSTKSDRIIITAIHDINVGQELFLPYGKSYWDDSGPHPALQEQITRRYDTDQLEIIDSNTISRGKTRLRSRTRTGTREVVDLTGDNYTGLSPPPGEAEALSLTTSNQHHGPEPDDTGTNEGWSSRPAPGLSPTPGLAEALLLTTSNQHHGPRPDDTGTNECCTQRSEENQEQSRKHRTKRATAPKRNETTTREPLDTPPEDQADEERNTMTVPKERVAPKGQGPG